MHEEGSSERNGHGPCRGGAALGLHSPALGQPGAELCPHAGHPTRGAHPKAARGQRRGLRGLRGCSLPKKGSLLGLQPVLVPSPARCRTGAPVGAGQPRAPGTAWEVAPHRGPCGPFLSPFWGAGSPGSSSGSHRTAPQTKQLCPSSVGPLGRGVRNRDFTAGAVGGGSEVVPIREQTPSTALISVLSSPNHLHWEYSSPSSLLAPALPNACYGSGKICKN